ncbi:S-adenosyl-L-methionine-dependent methyltransferase [Calycina marina]|uniref:S-adenosyl-L-methionine-dependent methyltransferase n=1 Tax=Calycina marina TaxID=1763456 RepID=A0A9P8CDC3_9HELO|nr:S-adenosyl-L-methionine-dependent methyltransferase [Calycina marina]
MAESATPTEEVRVILVDLKKAAAGLDTASNSELQNARRTLQMQAQKLVYSLEEPNAAVWPRIFQVNVSAALEVISQFGIWERFEGGKSVFLAEIVTLTGADESIIAHIFVESDGPKFTLTSAGKPYLHPDHRAFNNFVFFDLLPTIMAMPHTLAEHQYRAPTKQTGTPFKWANGEELWTWMGSHPDRAAQMVAGVRSHDPSNAYPWDVELEKLGVQDNDIAVVDVAGGKGHIMDEVRRRYPNIKGRFIVQDLLSTFEAVPTPPEGVEFMAYDIFTPQPVKDAFIYHYRHIFHNWSDGDCTTFLGHVVPLLKLQPRSKLLLVDLVLPDRDATMQQAIADLSMFPLGGMERSEGQWKELLAKSGLGIRNIWRGSELEACVECYVL